MSSNPTDSDDVVDLLADAPKTLADEEFTELLYRPGVRIERIVSTGHVTPDGEWFDQVDDEWVLVLSGAARLELLSPAAVIDLRPGQAVLIAAHRKHRVVWTSPSEPTVWVAVHVSG